jgi:4-alpha-glucanotransferase
LRDLPDFIEPQYHDIWGKVHETPETVRRAILECVSGGPDPLTEWSGPLDPAIVVREDASTIPLRIPVDRSAASVGFDIHWENGDRERHCFRLSELETLETATIGGREFAAKSLPLPKLPRLGYHDIHVYWMREPEPEWLGQTRLIVCPEKAQFFEGRAAGVAVSLYGLRSARNWGCGDFSDLRAVIDAFAPAGAAFIALNPLHAIPNRAPYNTSPYLPQSSLYRNFIYLDVERTGEIELTGGEAREIEALRASEFVEYEHVAQLKYTVLKRQFERFPGSLEFDRYMEAEDAPLHDFAVYCVLDREMHRRDPNVWLWTDWPREFQDPRSPAVGEFAREHERDVLFYKFLQWQIYRQLAETQAYAIEKGMRIGLYHDLALATDRYGADLWANRGFYVAGCRVGAPPDDVAPQGQDWGFPPPNREAHRSNGYELFAQSIRKNVRHGGALRIDHVMRFFRLYWIPDNMDASQGAYVRDYAQDLLRIVALASVREKFIAVGEDLGTVTDEVRQALSRTGILGYRLLWFEKNADGTFRLPHEYPKQAVVSTTTHDLPTLAGFGTGRDIEARRSAGLIDQAAYEEQLAARARERRRLDEALAAAGFAGDPIGFILSTPCTLAVINQEDLTGETEQQNLPGSTWQYPNWRRKMKVPVEELGPSAAQFGRAIERSGRKGLR